MALTADAFTRDQTVTRISAGFSYRPGTIYQIELRPEFVDLLEERLAELRQYQQQRPRRLASSVEIV